MITNKHDKHDNLKKKEVRQQIRKRNWKKELEYWKKRYGYRYMKDWYKKTGYKRNGYRQNLKQVKQGEKYDVIE